MKYALKLLFTAQIIEVGSLLNHSLQHLYFMWHLGEYSFVKYGLYENKYCLIDMEKWEDKWIFKS